MGHYRLHNCPFSVCLHSSVDKASDIQSKGHGFVSNLSSLFHSRKSPPHQFLIGEVPSYLQRLGQYWLSQTETGGITSLCKYLKYCEHLLYPTEMKTNDHIQFICMLLYVKMLVTVLVEVFVIWHIARFSTFYGPAPHYWGRGRIDLLSSVCPYVPKSCFRFVMLTDICLLVSSDGHFWPGCNVHPLHVEYGDFLCFEFRTVLFFYFLFFFVSGISV